MSCVNTKTFYSNISLAKNELLNTRIENKTTAGRLSLVLNNSHDGYIVWDIDVQSLYVWQDSQWYKIGPDPAEADTLDTVTTRGNITANNITVGNITATSFIKVGGTQTQFLKADGSVDSNTYITIAALAGYATENWVSTNFYTKTQINDFFSGAQVISGYNKINWDSAYNSVINSASFNTATGELVLVKRDASTVTVDLDGRYILNGEKGQPNGVATLDGGGKIPSSQLPSYVDDVLEYANLAAFPVIGETGKIYVALDSNKIYRWSGSTYIEISSNNVTGSGTTNYLTKWSSGSTLGTSVVYDNGTNVGIGTATPTQRLDVSGSIALTGDIIQQNSNLDMKISGTLTGRAARLITSTNGLRLQSIGSTTSNLVLSTTVAGTEVQRLTILEDGNVGINTSTPNQKLEVSGNQRITGGFLEFFGGSTHPQLSRNGVSGGLIINTSGAVSLAVPLLSVRNNSGVDFITVIGSGNVGIGTTGPAGKLDIYDASTGSLYVRTGTAGANWLTSTASSQIGTYTNHPFYIKTNDSTAVTILGSGNVGIGTTNPLQALDVRGNIRLGTVANSNTVLSSLEGGGNSIFKIKGENYVHTVVYETSYFNFEYARLTSSYSGSDTIYDLKKSDAAGVIIGTTRISTGNSYFNGSVGVGNTAPSEALHVTGRIRVTTVDNGIGDFLTLSATGVITDRTAAQVLTDIGGAPASGSTNYIQNQTASAQSASYRISGTGQAVSYQITTYNSTGSFGSSLDSLGSLIISIPTTYTGGWARGLSYQTAGTTNIQAALGLYGTNTTAERLYMSFGAAPWGGTGLFVTSANNVGIGTTNPAYKLDVNGTIGFAYSATNANYIEQANGAFGYGRIRPFNGSGLFDFDTNYTSGGGYNFRYNGTSLVRIASTGNVGIGTTSPSSLLHLSNSVGPIITMDDTAGRSTVFRNVSSSTAAAIGTVSNHTFQILTNNTSRIFLTETGNVGIGTTSPAEKLDINGGNVLITSAAPYISLKTTQTGTPDWKIYNSYNVVGDFTIVGGSSVGNKFNIQPNGNVGIGTTNPLYNLHVSGNSTGTPQRIVIQNLAAGQSSYDLITSAQHTRLITSNSKPFFIYDQTATSELFTILSGGNVGINTTTPSQKLHVVGSAYITGALYDSTNSPGTAGQVLTSTATGTDWKSLSEITGVDGTGSTNFIAKWSDADTITSSQIYDNGTNLGIGTTSPAKKLDVTGIIRGWGTGATNLSSAITGAAFQTEYSNNPSTGTLSIGTLQAGGGNTAHYIQAANTAGTIAKDITLNPYGGNLGIGTTTPSNKLQVVGTTNVVNITGAASGTTTTLFSIDGANGRLFEVSDDLSDSLFSVNTIAGLPVMEAFSDYRVKLGPFANPVTITSNGDINLNSTGQSIKWNNINILNTTSVYTQIYTPEGVVGINIGDSLDRSNYYDNNAHSFRTASGAATLAFLNSTGLGIGTTSPAQKLHVVGTIRQTAVLSSLLKTNASGDLIAAVAGTDYQNPITLTTTGSSGSATLVSNTLNVPTYTLSGLGGQPLNTNLTSLSSLSYASTSFVKMTAAGTFALDTNTYYLASNPNGYTTNTGTVTTLSVVSANGFAGTVATASTTPAITLSTTVTGLLKGNGTAISAAVAGVDYQAPITNNVTGTGTATRLAFWDTSSSIASDGALYWDNTNKRLGIGTTTPGDTLTVSGTFRSTSLWTTSSGVTHWGANTTAYGTLTWDTGYARIHANTGNRLDLGAGGGLHMSIATSGNVGIGTTSPVYKVDVQGSSITDSSVRVQGAFDINPLAAPPVIGGFTLSAGTSLGVGQYYYFVTYVTAVGETSAGGNLSVVTTSANTTVNLTGIPISSDPRVTARKLYRTSLNQSSDSHRFLGTISNNTQTTYTDSTPDASLTGNNLQLYKVNTTSRYITVSGTQGMVIDTNLTTLGRNAGNQIISTSSSAIRTVLIGASAGQNITTGFANVIVGVAGAALTTGGNNALFGDLAGYGLTTASDNTILGGDGPGRFLTTGSRNTIVGGAAGRFLYDGTTQFTTGADNTIIGARIRMLTASDTNSIVIGYDARGLGSNTVAIGNTSTILTSIPYGSLGVGTISPTSKLDVNNTTAASSSGQDTLRIGGSIDFANAGSGPKLTFYRQDNNVNLASVRAYTFGSLLTGLAFDTGYNALTTKMVIDNAGNVGIGTSTPTSNLVVSSGSAPTLKLENTANIGTTGWVGTTISSLEFSTTDPSSPGTYARISAVGGSGSAGGGLEGDLIFSTTPLNTPGSIAERVRINSIGNVGIGTITPTFKLQVVSSTGDDGISLSAPSRKAIELLLNSGVNGGGDIRMYAGVNVLTNRINAQGSSYINGGNLGIGTTSPSQKLHVDGSAYITGALYDSTNSPGTAGQVLTSTATGTDWKSLSEITGVDGTGVANYVAKWSDTDTITTSTIYDDGTNVGVGIATPGYKLHVEGTGYYKSTLNIEGTTTIGNASSGTIKLSTHATNFGYITGGPGAGGWDIGIGTSNAITIVNSGGPIKVGIKKLNPQYDLDLDGTVNSNISRHFQQVLTFYNYNLWNINTFDGAYWIQSTSPFSTPNYNAFYISLGSETIVIGDANTHHLTGATTAKLSIFNDAKNTSGNIFLARNTAAVDKFVIKDDGKVGVGTTTPTVELEVQGTTNATEIRQNNIPIEQLMIAYSIALG